jgi:hypothetical protein
LTGNSAGQQGGGGYGGTLNNCTLSGNSVREFNASGGGTAVSVLNNCIVYYNSAGIGPNYQNSTLSYCCVTPLPTGPGNFTNAPLFIDTNGWSNMRLQSSSPCINAGLNAYAQGSADLDGSARISGGTVDIGPYEFQSPASVISYAWLGQYGMPIDGSADYADPDHDAMNNWQEWRAGTSPLDASSLLRILRAAVVSNGLSLTWKSVSGVSYTLERSANLLAQPAFSILPNKIIGLTGSTTFIDTNAPAPGPSFYRVGVR